MNAPLFRFVLWRHRFALVATWLVPILVAVAVGLIYPTYAKEREALSRLIKFADKFFSDETIDLLSPVGFLLIPFQHPLTLLMLAMAAAVAPLGLPAGDRGRGALDVLLATPLERQDVTRTSFAVVILVASTFGWAPFLGIAIAAHQSGYAAEIPFDTCALIALNAGALVLALGAVALLVSAMASDGAAATTWFVAFVVVTLAVDVVARFWKAGDWLRWVTLLGYYRPQDLVAKRVHPAFPMGILAAFGAVTYACAEVVARKRRRA